MGVSPIIALDFSDIFQAEAIVEKIGGAIDYYKVGLELFVSAGPAAVSTLKKKGKKVFLDLKFHDIPNTASNACAAAALYGADMMNVHVQGGFEMMKACAETLRETCEKNNIPRPRLLGVTLLTSLDAGHLKNFDISHEEGPEKYVLKLALAAKACGLDGVVSSPGETPLIKEAAGKDFLTVTPGIRPSGSEKGDQKRTASPGEAKNFGADYIVVGRPVTRAKDPALAAEALLKELS